MEDHLELEFGGGGGGGKRGMGMIKKKMKNSNNNKRRFSEDQVMWLETMFQNEAKLEPRQKAEVASQLGLHPRQVAIWFQNKRARWKSKQLQQDLDTLRCSYDALASRFDVLTRESQSLSLEVQKLRELVGDAAQEHNKHDAGGNGQESESNNSNKNDGNAEKKPGVSIEEEGSHHHATSMVRGEGSHYFNPMVEPTCSSLTSDEEWHGLQSDGLFDQSPSSCEWWDFWC